MFTSRVKKLIGGLLASVILTTAASALDRFDESVMFLGGLPIRGVDRPAAQVGVPPSAILEARIWTPVVDDPHPDTTIITGAVTPDRLDARSGQPSGEFGSVKFRIAAFPAARRWERVRDSLASCRGEGCAKAERVLADIVAEARDLRFVDRLSLVNRSFNKAVAYVPDSRNYGRRDHWATVGEVLGRGRGDCEDYAIVKMAALMRAGVPERSMSVLVLYDHGNRAFHAVLSVATSKGTYILDNMRDDVYLDVTRSDYQPLYSLSADRAWIHGVRKPSLVAARDLGSIEPGEGVFAD